MKASTFLLFSVLTLLSSGIVLTEQDIYELEKLKNAFARKGTRSHLAPGSEGPNVSSLTSMIEMTSIDGGFIIRDEKKVISFDDNFNKVWEKDLVLAYKLIDMPNALIRGDLKNTYFVESKTNQKPKYSIHSINKAGKMVYKEIEFEKGVNIKEMFFYNENLCLMEVDEDRKNDVITYKIHRMNPLLERSEKNISLPFSDYEIENSTGYWSYLGEKNGNAILIKQYFQDVEKEKAKHLVIETIELGPEEKILNHRKWPFDAYIIDEDRKFANPKVIYDGDNQELYILGCIAIDARSLNGLYLIKYNYSSQDRIFSKEFSIKELIKGKKTENKINEEISPTIASVVPMIDDHDITLNIQDKTLTIQIINDLKGSLNNWEAEYIAAKFDKYGDHVATNVVSYSSCYYWYHNGVKSFPTSVENLYQDNTRPHLSAERNTSFDYSLKHLITKKDEIYFLPIDRKDYSIIVSYNEDNGKFSATKIQ